MNKVEILKKKIELARLELELAEVEAGRVKPKAPAERKPKRARKGGSIRRKETREFLLDLAAFLGRSVSSQKELAVACGLSPSTISSWMLGKTTPSESHMNTVAKFIEGYGNDK